jgi:hypothetical protein
MTRNAAFAAALALSGCNQVLGVEQTRRGGFDHDGDGLLDSEDNCPTVPNPSQADSDGDGVGDACDDCPLVANTQGVDFDGDGIGDACDPHPIAAGDCLLVVDAFSDPAAFAEHWTIVGDNGALPTVTVAAHALAITPQASVAGGIVASDPQLAFAVHVAGSAHLETAAYAVAAIAQAAAFPRLDCALLTTSGCIGVSAMQQADATKTPFDNGCEDLSTAHVADNLLLRVTLAPVSATTPDPALRCRLDYGVAVGDTIVTMISPMPGRAAALVSGTTLTISAIASYGFTPGVACPDPVFR